MRQITVALLVCLLAHPPIRAQETGTRAPRPHDPNRTELLALTLTPGGFTLPSLSIQQGLYYILVDDKTGGPAAKFQLERAELGKAREKVNEAAFERGRYKFQSVNRLTPGTYKLSVVGFPQWECVIEVK